MMKIFVRRTVVLVVVLILAVAAVGCAGSADKATDLPQVVHKSGEMDHEFPEGAPEEMRSMKNPMGSGDSSDMDKGEALFQANCVRCHGTKGDGKGAEASGLNPPPADFTAGHFQVMSDELVYYIMTTGIKGSAMPSWSGIPTDDRWRIIHYVRSLAAPESDGHGGMSGM